MMKNLFFGAIVLFTWCLFQLSAAAQVPLEYNYHKILHHENSWASGTHLRISASPFDDFIISHMSLATNVASAEMDISLHQGLEPILLEGNVNHVVFRLHNPDDLTTAHQLYLRRSSLTGGTIGAGIQYCENFLSIEISLDTAEYITLNGQTTFENPIPEKRGKCRVFIDLDGNYLEHVCLMYVTQGSSGGNFITKTFNNLAGTMDASVRIHDFNFIDTVEVVSSDSTYLLYSPTKGFMLSAETSDGVSYAGTLNYNGHLNQLATQAFENGVIRLFDIRGTADLNPTATTYNYSTPPGESHLIMVAYDEYGQIGYVNRLAIFDSMHDSPGGFGAKLMRYNSMAVVHCFFGTSIYDGNPAGVFSAMVEEDTVDTGVLFHTNVHGQTPQYQYVIEAETGTVTSVYSGRFQSTGTEGFTYVGIQNYHSAYFGNGLFALRGILDIYGNSPTRFFRHYPIEEELTLPMNPDTDHLIDYLLFPLNPDEPEQLIRLVFNSMPPYYIMTNIARGSGNDILFGGIARGEGEMLFTNEEWVPFSADYFSVDGIFIHTSEMTVNISEHKKAGVQIYPNPTSGHLNISRQSEENAGYIIYSLTGSEISRGTLQGRNGTISVDELQSGMYLLTITGKDRIPMTQKFIVK